MYTTYIITFKETQMNDSKERTTKDIPEMINVIADCDEMILAIKNNGGPDKFTCIGSVGFSSIEQQEAHTERIGTML